MLEDGRVFRGESFGAVGETIGEIVFSTGMTGYQETLTDPSYKGQIVAMTAPHIGNTGVNDEDFESRRIWVDGYIVRDPARVDRATGAPTQRSSDDAGSARGRRHLRHRHPRPDAAPARARRHARRHQLGTTTDVEGLLARVTAAPGMKGANFLADVTTDETYVVPAVGDKRLTVAAIDLGIKGMTPRRMAERGIEVHVMPATTTYEEITAISPDGVFMSNGPGDPATTDHVTAVLKQVLAARIPYFGICLGNQVFGRALDLGTYKLVYGHRGINQPVQDLTTGKVEITAHNHGFAVDAPVEGTFETPYGPGRVTHVCLNDNVVEGLALLEQPAFSVQYHPEAAAGPHDAAYLFDRFVDLMTRLDQQGRCLNAQAH